MTFTVPYIKQVNKVCFGEVIMQAVQYCTVINLKHTAVGHSGHQVSCKGSGCFLEKESLPSLLRTGCTGSGTDLSGFTIKLSLIEGLIRKIDLNVE